MLICAALSRTPGHLMLDGFSEDIEATMQCLRALGAKIEAEADGLWIEPPAVYPAQAALDAGESGSTLRFLLPVLGALGVRAQIRMHGRLPERPLSPLWELLEAHGMQLRREDDLLHVCGQLQAGSYALPAMSRRNSCPDFCLRCRCLRRTACLRSPGSCSRRGTSP